MEVRLAYKYKIAGTSDSSDYTVNMRDRGLKKKRLKVDKGLKSKVKAIPLQARTGPEGS